MATGTSTIIESTMDPYWGARAPYHVLSTTDPSNLIGYNILGSLLGDLREVASSATGISTDSSGGSNYDSLIVRTVALPVQVAYWI